MSPRDGSGRWPLRGAALAAVAVCLAAAGCTGGSPLAAGGSGSPAPTTVLNRPVAATDQPRPTPTGSAPPAPAGTLITQGPDLTDALADGTLLVVLDTGKTPGQYAVETYDEVAAKLEGGFQLPIAPGEQFAGGCLDGLYALPDGSSVLVAEYLKNEPAQGVVAATAVEQLVGLDPLTGAELWTVPLTGYVPDDDNTATTSPCNNGVNGSPQELSVTSDGYLVDTLWSNAPYVVDLATGTATHEPGALQAIGRWVAVAQGGTFPAAAAGVGVTSVQMLDPDSGAIAATVTSPTAIALIDSGMFTSGAGAVSRNGTVLYEGEFGIFALPGFTPLWPAPSGTLTRPWGAADVAVDPDTGAVVLAGGGVFGLAGADTGAVRWTQDSMTQLCGVTDGLVYGIANNQLAVLNEATGAQESYDPSVSQCPQVLDGAVGEHVPGTGGAGTVTRFTTG